MEWGLAALAGVFSGIISGWLIWVRQNQKQWEDRDTEKLYEILNALIEFRELMVATEEEMQESHNVSLYSPARRIKENSLVLVHEDLVDLGNRLHVFAVSKERVRDKMMAEGGQRVVTELDEVTSLMVEVWETLFRKRSSIKGYKKREDMPKALNLERYSSQDC